MPRGRWTEDGRRWTEILLGARLSASFSTFDLSTITVDTGVSQWRDKSGYGRHASTTVRKPSLLTGVLNGYPVIGFTGANATKLDTPDFALAPNRQFCSFAIVSGAGLTGGSAYPRIWVSKGTGDAAATGSTYSAGFFGAGPNNNTAMQIAGGSGITSPQLTGLGLGPLILTGRFGTAGAAANENTISANGGTAASLTGQTGALSTTGIRIGSDVGTSNVSSWNSWIAALILTTDISLDESRKVEGFLAFQAGLKTNLAAAHLYRNRPPMAGRTSARQGWERVR